MRISLLGVMTAILGVVFANGFILLFISLVIIGLAAAATHNGATTVLSELFRGRVRRIMALASALWFGSSILSAPLVGGWLDLTQQRNLQDHAFRLLFLLLMTGLAACLWLIHRSLHEKQVIPDENIRNQENPVSPSIPGSREWLWIPYLAGCHGMMVIALIAWLNPMSQTVFGGGDFHGGMLFGVAAFGLATGRFILAAHHFQVDDRTLLAGSGFAGSILLVIALQAPTYWTTFILVGLAAFTVSSTAPCLFSLIGERFPLRRSRLFGYFEASVAGAAVTGSFTVGALIDLGVPVRMAMGLSPLAALLLAVGSLIWRLNR